MALITPSLVQETIPEVRATEEIIFIISQSPQDSKLFWIFNFPIHLPSLPLAPLWIWMLPVELNTMDDLESHFLPLLLLHAIMTDLTTEEIQDMMNEIEIEIDMIPDMTDTTGIMMTERAEENILRTVRVHPAITQALIDTRTKETDIGDIIEMTRDQWGDLEGHIIQV
jgi:hypothetical protein